MSLDDTDAIAAKASPGLVVRGSAIEGRGVFATRAFAAGETIHNMGGERINVLHCGLRIALGRLRFDDPLQVGPIHFIDLDAFSVCFNSSCAPNAALRRENELFALRPIRVGEEITFDYAMTVLPSLWNRGWKVTCNCGAPDCRGYIGALDSVPTRQLHRHNAAGAGQRYVRAYIQRRCAADASA